MLLDSSFSPAVQILGRWYAKRSLSPLRRLTETIVSIEKGDFTKRVDEPLAEDEIRDLSSAFNRMASRVERLIIGMKNSLDNLAHDIRTPLTRARNFAESAILSGDQEKFGSALEGCTENLQELTTLVEQVLDLSEADAGAISLKKRKESVRKIAEEVMDLYQLVADEKQISIKCDIGVEIEWNVDRLRLKRVLANLVDNAVKFAPLHSQVTIRVFVESGRLMVEVEDQGPGIPSDDLPRIWERLYRGDKSRTENGMGIGLALVRSIVLAHSGEVAVKSTSQSGTTFRIALP